MTYSKVLQRAALGLALWGAGGCATLGAPGELRPPPHPLLEGWFTQRPFLTMRRAARAHPSRLSASTLRDTLDRYTGAHMSGAEVARVIVRSEGVSVSHRLPDLRRATHTGRGPPPVGALVFFRAPTAEVPKVGVLRRLLHGGVWEVVTRSRGVLRRVRMDPDHPNLRRAAGRVHNTFLRRRRRADPPRTAYLAGQLFVEWRAP